MRFSPKKPAQVFVTLVTLTDCERHCCHFQLMCETLGSTHGTASCDMCVSLVILSVLRTKGSVSDDNRKRLLFCTSLVSAQSFVLMFDDLQRPPFNKSAILFENTHHPTNSVIDFHTDRLQTIVLRHAPFQKCLVNFRFHISDGLYSGL